MLSKVPLKKILDDVYDKYQRKVRAATREAINAVGAALDAVEDRLTNLPIEPQSFATDEDLPVDDQVALTEIEKLLTEAEGLKPQEWLDMPATRLKGPVRNPANAFPGKEPGVFHFRAERPSGYTMLLPPKATRWFVKTGEVSVVSHIATKKLHDEQDWIRARKPKVWDHNV